MAYGLRAAIRIGRALGVTPPSGRADRAAAGRAGLGAAPLPYSLEAVLEARTDKKHAGGRLRWVLPTADGVVVRDDVPDEVVREAAASVLAGTAAGASA